MIYLAGEMLFCLTVSLIIGFITGWLLRGVTIKKQMKTIDKLYQINLASLKSKKPFNEK